MASARGIAAAVASVIPIVAGGLVMSRVETMTQPILFWAFLGASVLGVACVVLNQVGKPAFRGIRGLLLLVLSFFVWRVSYFPVMVISGFHASLAEEALLSFDISHYAVYPTFLLSVFGLHAVGTWWASLVLSIKAPTGEGDEAPKPSLFKRLSPLFILGGAPMIAMATAVSFTGDEDARILPDHPWTEELELPPVSMPVANPYLPRLEENVYSFQQKVLLWNAGMTYDYVPHSPWGAGIKGTLEVLFNDEPVASTWERTVEHHLAYLAAHQILVDQAKDEQKAPEASVGR